MTKLDAVVAMVVTVGQLIQELGEVRSGVLYSNLMQRMSLHEYRAVLDILLKAQLITEKNFLITWVGPVKDGEEPSGYKPEGAVLYDGTPGSATLRSSTPCTCGRKRCATPCKVAR